jgi:acetoin utilization deacetylase AcuC-like enzyme
MTDHHPECPERLIEIMKCLEQQDFYAQLTQIEAKKADRKWVESVHSPGYIDQLEGLEPQHGLIMVDEDTALGPNSLQAIWLAAGAGLQAVDQVLSGQHRVAFCATRPPGHHAEPRKAMGFCFFSNIAIAAKYALDHYGLDRVAVIDFDVHQANGTIECLRDEPRALVCTSFQHPYYPNSHWYGLPDHIINLPIEEYSDGNYMKRAVDDVWAPALSIHQPQLILISAGFDAHRQDPMAQVNWETRDYAWLTRWVQNIAYKSAGGRIVSMLEGGYSLEALPHCVATHLGVFADDSKAMMLSRM